MRPTFFLNENYQRHNRRRQEHLASLLLPLTGKTVLELGAGIGDHTSFFLDRGCDVTSTDARQENVACIQQRFSCLKSGILDIEQSLPASIRPHSIVYAYGLLYHLKDPYGGLLRMATLTTEMLLLETCVSFGDGDEINPVEEAADNPTQAFHGVGCRPTRSWIFKALKRSFEFVYSTRTQPWHEEFPVNWRGLPPENETGLFRSIFVASRDPISNGNLTDHLPDVQTKE